MTEAQCVAFLTALRAKNIYVKDNGWVVASCVLARWTHKNHTDSTPSFGLSISPGERSHFLCFACRQGSVEELLSVIEFYAKDYPNNPDYNFLQCHQILADEQYVVPLPEYGEFPHPTQVFQEWPQYWLESFQLAAFSVEAYAYLQARGLDEPTIALYQLRWDSKRKMVIAPYWDVFHRFAGARGRSVVEESKQKHHDYTWQDVNNARLVWFNEQVLNLPGPVVVVEGQFDAIRTAQAFPKTVANLTAKPTMDKMKKLGGCDTVIQIPDRDETGQQSVGVYAGMCKQLGLQHRVVWLEEGVKDPAECHVEYLKEKIAALNCT